MMSTFATMDSASLRTYPANPFLPSAGYLTDFRLSTSTTNGAPRSRFTQERREEVRNIRKLGACLRCRMLKKPCSPGDPCETCSKVETARLWKRACVRTKLADELDVLDSGFYKTMAHEQVSAAAAGAPPSTTSAVTFTLRDEHEAPTLTLPSIICHISGPNRVRQEGSTTVEMIDFNSASIMDELGDYVQSSCRIAIEHEEDPWVRATLRTTLTITQQRFVKLLQSCLCLWCSTHLLTSQGISILSRRIVTNNGTNGRTTGPESKSLMTLQINALLESLTSRYARRVATELEQRLQQRHKGTDTRLETLLASVVLFNSLEKMACSFHHCQNAVQDIPHRCDGVTDLLTMLLRVRGVPFPTAFDDQDRLVQRQSNPSQTPDAALSTVTALLETQCKEPAWMLDSILLEHFVSFWIEAAGVTAHVPDDGPTWRHMYIKKILGPE